MSAPRKPRTEASYRARGLVRPTLRMPPEYVDKLDELRRESGRSRAEQVMALIDAELEEYREPARSRRKS